MITPERGLRAIDGLLTGWHEPESSHLLMLEAAAGRELLDRSYDEAARLGFVGHEFGDSHLILPETSHPRNRTRGDWQPPPTRRSKPYRGEQRLAAPAE